MDGEIQRKSTRVTNARWETKILLSVDYELKFLALKINYID